MPKRSRREARGSKARSTRRHRGRGQVDGRQLIQMYQDLGLHLTEADNAVESGLYELLTRMTSGRLKVFKSLQNWLGEFRLYRRDEKGRVVKPMDHLMAMPPAT